MKNINHFLKIVAYCVLLCVSCTDAPLNKENVHQVTETVGISIDSIETQIHSETQTLLDKKDKDLHRETTPTEVDKDLKDSHVEAPTTVHKETKDSHVEVPTTVHKETKDSHVEAPTTLHKETKDSHVEAPTTVHKETKDLHEEVQTEVYKENLNQNTPIIYDNTDSDHLLRSYVSWPQFCVSAFGLFVLYFILRFAKQILTNTQYFGDLRLPLLSSIERILIFYEPIVILLLGSAFVLINPAFHGMWIALLLFAGFSHVKNYISGRILQLDKGMSIGNRIKVNNQKGVISAIDRLGLQLTTDKGIQYLNYSRLSDDGFLLLSGEEIGGNYHLKISPKEYNERLNYPVKLMDVFATTPFLDWNHRPKIGQPSGEHHTMNVKVMVREDAHLPDLMQLIEERGYVCSIK